MRGPVHESWTSVIQAGIAYTIQVTGFSMMGGSSENVAFFIFGLDNWTERMDPVLHVTAIRRFIGTTVFWGMLAANFFGIMLVPVLFVLFQTIREKAHALRNRNANTDR